ncbi:hypothetical protein GGTG_12304 [Gaeumannomyces tritici R3-111a-1]|uniref:NADPH-dependent 1-acyldihydroxyacetone phosphate reductase n=1 Tax=Gaeumannomyces tritici (strain R3-111a-1) TaxID=644352 RepID=J3PFM9_GAET3|nr:hypothetical protein GGTG_12304 [Gaeumannomyces tritici R3-111a-1]EJT70131.1 hypothetical protein GGTG_12304 [Gaeumannomyces tritici R3-111a-1]
MSPKPGQKTVLVTGCTPGGIGHAVALEYHKQGLYVIATARRPEALKELTDKGLAAVALEVTDADSIAACKDEVAKLTGGKLDILVNNAGRSHTIPATDIDLPDVRQTFETNVFSVMAMVQAFAPLLIAARGLIVNIASLSSVTPYVFGAVYCATKGAVVAYSRTLRQELRPFGVRVMIVMAGTVRSNAAAQKMRSLPADSIYQRIRDVFEWRLNYSQNNNTEDTPTFARKLVRSSLRPEFPMILRSWLGRPDWFWAGGQAGTFWIGSYFGEWLIDMVCWRKFKLGRLEAILKKETSEAKKLK